MCSERTRPCRQPFAHREDDGDYYNKPCGHQILVFPCGCTCDDHDHDVCDGMAVAELEESR